MKLDFDQKKKKSQSILMNVKILSISYPIGDKENFPFQLILL